MSIDFENFLDCGIEDEEIPKIKFNSLISVTISTVMCLAAKCPLPKSNVETTKKFLSTITDDNGKTPKNIKGFLNVLNNYKGPYDNDIVKENVFEKPPVEKPSRETEVKTPPEEEPLEKTTLNQSVPREGSFIPEPISATKKLLKFASRRGEKDPKKPVKSPPSRVTPSKSLITSK